MQQNGFEGLGLLPGHLVEPWGVLHPGYAAEAKSASDDLRGACILD